MPKLFISYRIKDSMDLVARLDADLTRIFGADAVFRDKTGIEGGAEWAATLEKHINSCKIMVVVIGPTWHSSRFESGEKSGQLRLLDPGDWVRREITTSLALGHHVLPILANHADMPPRSFLQQCGLQRLPDLQAMRLRSDDYAGDLAQLVAHLQTQGFSPLADTTGSTALPVLPARPPLERFLQIPASNVAPTTPAQLLTARHRVVPFDRASRAVELATLDAFCEISDGAPIALQIVTGQGGAGKTRLLIEWCQELLGREEPWLAGFLSPKHQAKAVRWLCAPGPPTLVVLDYAETRGTGEWLADLLAEGTQRVLRIVLLARHAGDWWEALGRGDEDVIALKPQTAPLTINHVQLAHGDRQRHYTSALHAFAAKQKRSVPEGQSSPDLSDVHFARPLYLHMAAMLALIGEKSEANELPMRVLEHECQFWRPDGHPPAENWHPPALQLMTALTLIDGALWHDAKQIAKQLCDVETPRPWLDRLQALYPPPAENGAHATDIARLEPDLLGETLVWHTLKQTSTPPNFLEALLQNASDTALAHSLTVLGRIGFRHPDDARAWAQQVFHQAPLKRAPLGFDTTEALATKEAGGVLGQALALALEGYEDLALATTWENRFSRDSVAMRELAVWVYRQILTYAATPEERAIATGQLGIFLGYIGDREEALSAAQKTVTIRRQLAKERPDVCLPGLATALSNFGVALRAAGKREEALLATQEAVTIRRQLAQARPDTSRTDLAQALGNLGACLRDVGQREEAVAATKEAVELYRKLAPPRTNDCLADLAAALSNLGISFSAVGLREEALSASQEAVELCKTIAHAHPDAYLPFLSRALVNLAAHLSQIGQREEAVAATREAIERYRELASARPDAFLSDLAMALSNFGPLLHSVGQREEAVAATREAADLHRALAGARPDAFLPGLATALDNLGISFNHVGRLEEALTATQEAVAIRRQLANARPDASSPDLARALNNLSIRYERLGQPEEALTATQETVDLFRTLAAVRPDAFLPDLATAVSNLSMMRNAVGRREEALTATQEAVDLFRTLAAAHPEAFLPNLATAVSNLGAALNNLGNWQKALTATQEAADLFKTLAAAHPEAFRADLARALKNLGASLNNLGRREDAPETIAVTREAVGLYRTLAQAHPDAFLPELAGVLSNLGALLYNLGEKEEALTATQEAVDICEALITQWPHLRPDLEWSQNLLQAIQSS